MPADSATSGAPPPTHFSSISRLQGPKGIGGWLLLFTVGQILALILNVRSAIDLSGFSEEAWALGEYITVYRPLIIIEAIGSVLLCIGGAVGLSLILLKKPQTPRFYTMFLAFVVGFGLIAFVGVALLYPKLIA